MKKEDDKEAYQQLVKRLAGFLGLKAVEKRVLGFKRYVSFNDQHSERNVIKIRGYPANCFSWKDALCKFLGIECFQVFTEPKNKDVVETEVLLVDNPFFDMSPEIARLHIDLLAPR